MGWFSRMKQMIRLFSKFHEPSQIRERQMFNATTAKQKVTMPVIVHNLPLITEDGAILLDDQLFLGHNDKVFYCEDPKNKGWSVVRHIKVKDVFDMGSVTGQDVDQGQSDGTFNASHLHRIGDDGDDGEDVTSDMEHDGTTMKRTMWSDGKIMF
ncbi:hypothetical protein Tco_0653962 [Tanacetum coccineum]|uniref:DUF4216 domain-containing protein n=1 Tax=Tanacetum coccineum TaxID=301880 RepID=A0ABQ4X272_9ASTR